MPQSYQYIIIGAGSAGCVLANRLSADPDNDVLLLEAGGKDRHPLIHIPGGCGHLHRSSVDWGFFTEPQKHLFNRRIYLPRGMTLGGCSSTNYMVYVRGNAQDYDDWAALGNKGWSYEEVLPYFKKSEHNVDFHSRFHGQGGELNVELAKGFETPYKSAFIDACIEQGFQKNQDYNGQLQDGVGPFQHTIKGGRRHSTAVAFLHPVKARKNLDLRTDFLVERIVIKDNKAIAVEGYDVSGQKHRIACRGDHCICRNFQLTTNTNAEWHRRSGSTSAI